MRHPNINPSAVIENNERSCLTINIPRACLALDNLLDLIRHEISHEMGRSTHRLTFKSGETLCIEADARGITVRGARIHFSPHPTQPSSTVLGDPARLKRFRPTT
jgi:hypothetical protein